MTPTHRLLLLLARVKLPEADRELARWYARRVDWRELFELAARGGIAGLVERHLEGLAAPREARRQFVAASMATEHTNRGLVEETLRLGAGAEAEGLMLLPIKGAALLLDRIYPELGAREMVDLDLLTSRSDLHQVSALLERLGYVDTGHREVSLGYYHHLAFERPVGASSMMVELHWTALHTMYSRPDLDAALLARATARELPGGRIRCLSDEDMWLILALHFAVHRYRGQLKWLVDLAEQPRARELDWSAVFATAGAAGARRATSYAGRLARTLLDAPVPEHALRPSGLMRVLDRISTPEEIVLSEDQPSLPRRLLINAVQYDSPASAVDWIAHKALELLDRHLGVRLPRTTRRSASHRAR